MSTEGGYVFSGWETILVKVLVGEINWLVVEMNRSPCHNRRMCASKTR